MKLNRHNEEFKESIESIDYVAQITIIQFDSLNLKMDDDDFSTNRRGYDLGRKRHSLSHYSSMKEKDADMYHTFCEPKENNRNYFSNKEFTPISKYRKHDSTRIPLEKSITLFLFPIYLYEV